MSTKRIMMVNNKLLVHRPQQNHNVGVLSCLLSSSSSSHLRTTPSSSMTRIRNYNTTSVHTAVQTKKTKKKKESNHRHTWNDRFLSQQRNSCSSSSSSSSSSNGFPWYRFRHDTFHQSQQQFCSSSCCFSSSTTSATANTDAASSTSNNDEASAPAASTPFLLADIGEGIKEVELMQWHVQAGQVVKQFDTVATVQSDKATVDISSRFDGVVHSLAGHVVGDMIQVGSPLMYIVLEKGTDGGGGAGGGGGSPPKDKTTTTTKEASAPPPTQQQGTTPPPPTTTTETSPPPPAEETVIISPPPPPPPPSFAVDTSTATDKEDVKEAFKIWTSPAVRRLCQEHNIDPRILQGTGPNGRILKADVMAYLERSTQPATAAAATTATASTTTTTSQQQQFLQQQADVDGIVTLKGYSRLMAQTMTASLAIPHMGLSDELDVTQLVEWRQRINSTMSILQSQNEDHDKNTATTTATKISLLAILLKACSLALQDFPLINATVHDIEKVQIKLQPFHHLGVAMDTPRGLVVPVIRNCDKLSIIEIQHKLNLLKADAAAGAVKQDDLIPPPTFTLSNIGALGAGLSLQPVLAPPQLAMGAIGRLCKVPRFVENDNENDDENHHQVVAAAVHILPISWVADHRFVDGATMARFHTTLARLIKDPYQMLLGLK